MQFRNFRFLSSERVSQVAVVVGTKPVQISLQHITKCINVLCCSVESHPRPALLQRA